MADRTLAPPLRSEVIRGDVMTWLESLAFGQQLPEGSVADFTELLRDMHTLAGERGVPIVGPQVGRLLAQLAAFIRPQRVFELGSGFGYSALWMAWACPGCRITCTDGAPDNRAAALRFFERGGVAERIDFIVGDAMEAMRATSGQFELVFVDVDKHQYPAAYDVFADRVAPGGAAVIDNLVWSGRVAAGDEDRDTAGVRRYIETMWNDTRFLSSLMPVRDGVGISYRLKTGS